MSGPVRAFLAPAWLAVALAALGTTTLSGWFHTLWNGQPRHVLVDEQGRWTELHVEEELLRARGGARALTGRRVTVSGEPLDEGRGPALRVRALDLDAR